MSLNDEVLEALAKTTKKFQVQKADFHKAVNLGDMTIISCNGKIGHLIGRKGIIVAELSKTLNTKVRLVENSKDHKKTISDLIGNARLLGVNEIYTPEGKEYKIIVRKSDSKKLTTTPESLGKAIHELLDVKAAIEFR